MAIKVYKSSYTIVVEDPSKDESTYTTASHCKFGFDGTVCWIEDLVSERYIFNGESATIADSAGTLVGSKSLVLAYLLAFVGDPSSTASPIIV